MTPAAAYGLYLVFALGGAATYLLLPKAGRSHGAAGAVIGLLAAGGLLAVMAANIVLPGPFAGCFYVFSIIAILAAARVVTHPKPVYSALYFVLVVLAVAALMVLQAAEFLAVSLIIIYAGAILVTYLFVIMLAQQPGSPVYDRRSREPFFAVLLGFVLSAALAGQAGELPHAATSRTITQLAQGDDGATSLGAGNTRAIGAELMTKYVVVLEVAGVLLLVSMVGAIGMSQKKVPVDTVSEPVPPLGQVGREVPPY